MMTTDRYGKFEMSLVDTTSVNLNKIWGRRLGLDNCSIIAYVLEEVNSYYYTVATPVTLIVSVCETNK